MTPEEIKGIAIESGLCRVDGFGQTVRAEFAAVNHILAFAKAIAAAARAEAIEECVAVCDTFAIDRWALYKGRAPYTGNEPERADQYTQGLSDGAEIVSGKIEALLDTGEKNG